MDCEYDKLQSTPLKVKSSDCCNVPDAGMMSDTGMRRIRRNSSKLGGNA